MVYIKFSLQGSSLYGRVNVMLVGQSLPCLMGHLADNGLSIHERKCFNCKYTRDVRNELLISIWRLQISSKPKSTRFMPSKFSPWLEMQSFSRYIHFLKASRYADLGTVIRY